MKKPEQFNKMIILTFLGILAFYLPMSVSGYWAYGINTGSPIYNNICDTTCSFIQSTGKWLAIFAITLHIMLSYAIVLNPTERAVRFFILFFLIFFLFFFFFILIITLLFFFFLFFLLNLFYIYLIFKLLFMFFADLFIKFFKLLF